MTWTIKVSERAVKALGKLDKPIAIRIYRELREIERLDNPKNRGKALEGSLRGLWCYRVGDYRIVCDIQDRVVTVVVVDVSHRSSAYREHR